VPIRAFGARLWAPGAVQRAAVDVVFVAFLMIWPMQKCWTF